MIKNLLQKLGLSKPDEPKPFVPIRFTKWEDVVPYLGKKVRLRLVEVPDRVGYLTGVRLWVDYHGEVRGVYFKIGDYYETDMYWNISPE